MSYLKISTGSAFSYASYSDVSVLGIYSLKGMSCGVRLLGLKIDLVSLHFSFLPISSLCDYGYFTFLSLIFPYL